MGHSGSVKPEQLTLLLLLLLWSELLLTDLTVVTFQIKSSEPFFVSILDIICISLNKLVGLVFY